MSKYRKDTHKTVSLTDFSILVYAV